MCMGQHLFSKFSYKFQPFQVFFEKKIKMGCLEKLQDKVPCFMSRKFSFTTMTFLLTTFFLIEIVVGYITNSMALIAEAFHMLSDVVSLIVAWLALKYSSKQAPKDKYTYGYARAEVLGALVNAVFLVALCFSIFIEAVKRLVIVEPIENPILVFWVGAAGLIVNLFGMFLFYQTGHGHSHGGVSHSHSHGNENDKHSHGKESKSHSHSHGSKNDKNLNKKLSSHSNDDKKTVNKELSKHIHIHTNSPGKISHRSNNEISSSSNNGHSHGGENGHSHGGENANGEHSHGGNNRHSHGGDNGHSHGKDNGHSHNVDNGHSHGGDTTNHSDTQDSWKHLCIDDDEKNTHKWEETKKLLNEEKNEDSSIDMNCEKQESKTQSAGQLNIHAVYLHILGDALGSVIVMTSALIIVYATGTWTLYVDPTMSIIMVMIILKTSIPLLVNTSKILMNSVPNHIQVKNMKERLLKKIPQIRNVHELHVWQLAGDKIIASVHVKFATPHDYEETSLKIKEFFHNEGIHSTTVQIEFEKQDNEVDRRGHCMVLCSLDSACDEMMCCKPGDDSK
ncbi:uncharacterized protein LOC100202575 isoform X2 [Hydra vulgaris]|uniref:uncharacterized protein LOC100202575 isoform X2 n=2 Tax=Hydra vulgaris TaxID=6087 RepID=UPI001F5F07D9|nr:zinc homeostasis factor 1 isoform X1 [Hydra vulgaris]